jgi:hypothetical protein
LKASATSRNSPTTRPYFNRYTAVCYEDLLLSNKTGILVRHARGD